MEQATNSFTKGLQMDTNPMVQDNETLTDCLNGTLITMNGNEVILQNDMGNRKVDNAFLPAGYEPVGMKEYGGIIYVAAYNPLTGRGQLGSFPSPERKFSPSDLKSKDIDLDDFIKNAGTDNSPRYIVKNSSIIKLLTEKTILHAGDKFSIYSSDIIRFLNTSQNINYILPENNYKKLFTFKVGILNSQNEFVDITDTLLKDSNNYFIFQGGTNPTFDLTKSNEELLKERNGFQNLNTYSYKIVSPLYLKVELNYIKQVQYRVYGEKNSNNTYDLEFTIIYTHENYINFNSYIPDSNLGNSPTISIKGYTTNEEGETVTEVAYTYSGLSPVNGIIHCEFSHYLYPIDFYQPKSNKIYIEDLYWEEDIDVSKLGSDTIEFNGWKYFNYLNDENSRSILSLNLQTYPKRQSNLKYLYLIIKENDTIDPIKQVSLLYQGSEEEPIPSGIWETSFIWEGIDKRKVYNCELRSSSTLLEELINNTNSNKIGYIINNNSTLIKQDLIFISTTLFNNNYNGKENLKDEAYILDGNSIRTGIKYDYTRDKDAYIEDFSFISNIIVTPTADISLSVNQNLTKDQSATTATNNADYTSISIKDEFNSRITINKSVKVLNEELYPSNISFNGVTVTISNNNKILYNNQEINDINSTLIKGEKTGSLDNNILSETITPNNNILNIKIVVKNQLKGDAELQTITTNNAIISFAKFLEENQSLMNVKKPFFSIDSESGEYFAINYVNSDSQDSTYTDINRKRLPTGYYDRDSSIINNYITSVNNDLFVGEQNGNDYLYTDYSTTTTTVLHPDGSEFPYAEGSGANTLHWNKWFYRIWFQYDQGKYIPIYIISCNSETEYNNFDFSNMYTYINTWASSGPPHYYNYVRESRSVQMSIVDLDNIDHYLLSDFDSINCDLSMHYVLGGGNNISIPNNYSGLFVVPTNNLDNLETKDIIKNIGKIHSNSTFNSLIEKLQTLDFDCVGMYYNSYAYNQGNKVALVDVDGNFLDSTYVYKLANEGTINAGLKKCYQPIRKYTIGDKIVLPNFYQESYLAENSISSYVNGSTINGITNVVMIQDEPNIHSSYPYIPPVIGRNRYIFNKIPNIKQL